MSSHPAVRAAAWMMGAMLSFTIMAVAGRSLAGHLDTFEIMTYRSALGVLLVGAFVFFTGSFKTLRFNRPWLHVFRNLCHFAGQNLWFYAIAYIPLSQLFAFEFTTPLWVAALAPFVLGERWTATRVLTIVTGFFGILLVARPDTTVLNAATVAAALCAVGFAGAGLCTKLLSRTETVSSIMFWLVTLQLLFGLVCAGADGHITMLNAYTAPWTFLVGICGLTAHLCITRALVLAPASVVIPLDFLRLPLITLVGYLLYQEQLVLSVFVGAAVILLANIINIRAESTRQANSLA